MSQVKDIIVTGKLTHRLQIHSGQDLPASLSLVWQFANIHNQFVVIILRSRQSLGLGGWRECGNVTIGGLQFFLRLSKQVERNPT